MTSTAISMAILSALALAGACADVRREDDDPAAASAGAAGTAGASAAGSGGKAVQCYEQYKDDYPPEDWQRCCETDHAELTLEQQRDCICPSYPATIQRCDRHIGCVGENEGTAVTTCGLCYTCILGAHGSDWTCTPGDPAKNCMDLSE